MVHRLSLIHICGYTVQLARATFRIDQFFPKGKHRFAVSVDITADLIKNLFHGESSFLSAYSIRTAIPASKTEAIVTVTKDVYKRQTVARMTAKGLLLPRMVSTHACGIML